jgi:hypothetical protein
MILLELLPRMMWDLNGLSTVFNRSLKTTSLLTSQGDIKLTFKLDMPLIPNRNWSIW